MNSQFKLLTFLLSCFFASNVLAEYIEVFDENIKSKIFSQAIPSNKAAKELTFSLPKAAESKAGERFALVEMLENNQEKVHQIRRLSDNSDLKFNSVENGKYRIKPLDACGNVFALTTKALSPKIPQNAGNSNVIILDQAEDKVLIRKSINPRSKLDVGMELKRQDEKRGEDVKEILVNLIRLDDNKDMTEDKEVDEKYSSKKGLVQFSNVEPGMYRVDYGNCLAAAWIPPTSPLVLGPVVGGAAAGGAVAGGGVLAGLTSTLAVGVPLIAGGAYAYSEMGDNGDSTAVSPFEDSRGNNGNGNGNNVNANGNKGNAFGINGNGNGNGNNGNGNGNWGGNNGNTSNGNGNNGNGNGNGGSTPTTPPIGPVSPTL